MNMRYLDRLKRIDEILAEGPSAVDFQTVSALLQESASEFYFFSRIEDGGWMEVLMEGGVFERVAAPVPRAGQPEYPPWPPAEALKRLAAICPTEVAAVLGRLSATTNRRVHPSFLGAALALPAELAAVIVPHLDDWLSDGTRLRYSEDPGALVIHLAEGGERDAALETLQTLIRLEPQSDEEGHESLVRFPRPRLDTWTCERFIERHLSDISWYLGLDAVVAFGDTLASGLRQASREDDHSNIWLPRLSSIAAAHGEFRVVLAQGLRDLAVENVDSDPTSLAAHLEYLYSQSFPIFHRLGMYLLSIYGDSHRTTLYSWLGRVEYLRNLERYPEYGPLLTKSFSGAPDGTRRRILAEIDAGLDRAKVRQNLEGFSQREVSEEELDGFEGRWRRDRLALIEQELDPAHVEMLDHLRERLGPPRTPFRDVSDAMVDWVGVESPRTEEELRAASWSEILHLLESWSSDDEGASSESSEGLAQVFSAVVTTRYEEAAEEAMSLVSVPHIYVAAYANGLASVVEADVAIAWDAPLRLFVATTRRALDEDSAPELGGRGWNTWPETLKAVARLLEKAVKKSDSSGLNPGEQTLIWTVVANLLEHWDPKPELEARQQGGGLDAATLSINSVRGQAMHLVVAYALWHRRILEARNDQAGLARGFETMPEVGKALDAHLDVREEPSTAVRAVYGQYFPWLHFLDPAWVSERVDLIFPPDSNGDGLFEAAWTAYVTFTRPFSNVWEILKPVYRRAIERLGRDGAPPDEGRRLGEHLVTYYWQGQMSLWSGELLAQYFRSATPEKRADAIQFIGRSLKRTESEVPPEVIARLVDLWEQRILVARESRDRAEHGKEMEAFGSWVASEKFSADMCLRRYRRSLFTAGSGEAALYDITSVLRRMWSDAPREVLEVLQAMAARSTHPWWGPGQSEEVVEMVKQALSMESVAPLAEDLANDLARAGLWQMRDAFDGEGP